MSNRLHIISAGVLLLATGCADSPIFPDLAEGGLLSSARANRTTYSATYDCSSSPVDPGTVKVVNGVFIQRGTVFHCPLSGDITGVMVVVQNLTLQHVGTPNVSGRATGTTEAIIDEFLGRTDLDGTFKGPFEASFQELLFGEVDFHRRGTGDFRGLVMQGIDVQFPPGSAILNETGEIFGRTLP